MTHTLYCKLTLSSVGAEMAHADVRYDGHGVFSSPRALYMFRNFGHAKSSVLDGGILRWVDEGLPTESGDTTPPSKGSYSESQFQGKAVKSKVSFPIIKTRYLPGCTIKITKISWPILPLTPQQMQMRNSSSTRGRPAGEFDKWPFEFV